MLKWHPDKCVECEYAERCQETGLCPVNQRLERPCWSNDFIVALEVYHTAIELSGCDFNGYPLLTLLDFAIQMSDYEVDNKGAFLNYIAKLHSYHCKFLSEK